MSEQGSGNSPLLGNRYQLQQTVGSGGMAVVYKARDLMLERPVAIKVLRESLSSDPAFRERFRQEARAAANLSHPNIVTVHDFGLDHEKLYIVMEYVPGTDLKSMIKKSGRLNIDEAIPLFVQACAGIGYAHRAGLIHCDVKPHNMLVTPDLRLKVTDFGIARALATIQPDEKSDVVWGSPQYFSPEQASGAAPSPASDVYSLGIILYEMLTGELPFNATDSEKLARMHREVVPIPPRRFNHEISPPLEQIVLKVLSKDPSSRYRTADQLGRILTTFSQQAEPYLKNIPDTNNVPSQPFAVQSGTGASANSQPVNNLGTNRPADSHPVGTSTDPLAIDWLTIGLGILATVSVGGLIPFWLYIWLTINTTQVVP